MTEKALNYLDKQAALLELWRKKVDRYSPGLPLSLHIEPGVKKRPYTGKPIPQTEPIDLYLVQRIPQGVEYAYILADKKDLDESIEYYNNQGRGQYDPGNMFSDPINNSLNFRDSEIKKCKKIYVKHPLEDTPTLRTVFEGIKNITSR